MGGAVRPEVVHQPSPQILHEISEDRQKLCPQVIAPVESCIYKWPQALPYYDLYLEETLKDLQLPKGLFLNGNYLGKIGLAGMIERGLAMPDIVEAGVKN